MWVVVVDVPGPAELGVARHPVVFNIEPVFEFPDGFLELVDLQADAVGSWIPPPDRAGEVEELPLHGVKASG